jgi:hypothetical protein
LEYQIGTNVEFMWLAHGHRIDHSTLASFRRDNAKAIKDINRQLLKKAKDLGVIKLAELYVDGTKIRANSSRHRTLTAASAGKLLEFVESQIDEFLQQADLADAADDLFNGEVNGEKLPAHLADLQRRKQELEAIKKTCEEADAQRKKKNVDPAKNPFQLPLTDSDSRIMPNKEGGYAPNYTPVVAVEGDLGLIVSMSLINTPNEQDCMIGLIDAVEADYDVTVDIVCADAAYSIGSNITELEEKRGKNFLSPHREGDPIAENPAIRDDPTQPVPESQWSELPTNSGTKKFSVEAFVYDAEADVYHCPLGKPLTPRHQEKYTQSNGDVINTTRYYAESCDGCPAFAMCRTKPDAKRPRSIRRDEHADSRERHRLKMSTEEAKAAYARRFSPGERIFGQLKEGFGMRRFQTRGRPAIESELGIGQLAHNVMRLINSAAGAMRGRSQPAAAQR